MAGITYDGIPSTETDSSIFSGTTVLSDVGSLSAGFRALNLTAVGSITDAEGRHRANTLGSPGILTGVFVQAGSLATSAGSIAFLALRRAYTGSYTVFLTPEGFVSAGAVATPTGTQNITSGVNVVGTASTTYNWMTVGA